MQKDTKERILAIIRANHGISSKNIAELMGVKVSSIHPYLQLLHEEGDVLKEGRTSNVLWYSA